MVWWRWKHQGEDESYGVWDAGGISGFNASHWMPLPESPVEEELIREYDKRNKKEPL